ncbi:MAG TPA: tetratricopeptide repeat protein [Candidatus Marinimicrobia bacterium]|nr:tetratricopeptide repeat protein [Candidatus Neomarinimicrobiota bacterium]HIB58782.1 tetratricopeptide repeat protein [Candidatus Neomarinimicrobiota bacterium]HIN46439.1 tetratricopeptide repeat protein [Candidatus Neomarinimicrobiota bacterium]
MRFLSNFFGKRKDSTTLYIEALEHLVDGKTDLAVTKLREVVQLDSSNVNAYVQLADILRKRNVIDQAIKIHRSLTIRQRLTKEQKILIQTSLAKDYLVLGKTRLARESSKKILELDRHNAWAADFLVRIAEDENDWEKADDLLSTFEKSSGDKDARRHARYRMMFGRSKESEGDLEGAEEDYKQAITFDKTYADPYLYLGNLHERSGDLEPALEHWRKFAELAPSAAKQVFERLEKALFQLGRYGDVEDFYHHIMVQNPNDMDALIGLVDVLQAKGDHERAMGIVDDALARNRRSIRARLARLKISLRRVHQDQLSAEVDKIVELIPSSNGQTRRSS